MDVIQPRNIANAVDLLQWMEAERRPEWAFTEGQIERLRLSQKLLTRLQLNQSILESIPVPLRINQLGAIQELTKFLMHAGRGDLLGYFKQPTGAGKTVLFGIIARLLDVPTLILVPKLNLLSQTRRELIRTLGYDANDIGIVGGKEFQTDRKVVIATYQSHLSRMQGRAKNPYRDMVQSRDLIVCDEAHRSLGRGTQNVLQDDEMTDFEEASEQRILGDIDTYTPRKALKLGFTATPELRGKSVRDAFKILIGETKIASLVNAGILTKLKLVQAAGFVDNDEIGPWLTEEQESAILEREAVYAKLVQKFKEVKERVGHLKTVAFCSTIEECDKFAKKAAEEGFRCRIITSREAHSRTMGDEMIEEAERQLISGEIDMIVSVEKLGEGWNFPELDAVIMARATLSPVRLLQPIGRAMRAFPGKNYAYVFETQWRRKMSIGTSVDQNGKSPRKKKNGSKRKNKSDQEPISVGRKPLSIAEALNRHGEDIEGICEMLEEESLEYEQECILDEKGIGEVVLAGKKVQVVGFRAYAVTNMGYKYERAQRLVDEAGIQPLPNIIGISWPVRVCVYRKEDIDKVLPLEKSIVTIAENGVGEIELDGEKLEVIAITSYAPHVGIFHKTLRKLINEHGVKPIRNIIGKSGTRDVELYKREEVDAIIPVVLTQAMQCQLNEDGIGEVSIAGAMISVVDTFRYAQKLGISKAALKRLLATNGINALENVVGRLSKGRVSVYRKDQIDAMIPSAIKDQQQLCQLDENGIGEVDIKGEKIAVIGIYAYASGIVGLTDDKLIKLIAAHNIQPVSEISGLSGRHRIPIYPKADIDRILPARYFKNICKLDSQGIGVVIIDRGIERKVIGISPYARYLGMRRERLQKLLEDAGIFPLDNIVGRSGSKPLDVFDKIEVDRVLVVNGINQNE